MDACIKDDNKVNAARTIPAGLKAAIGSFKVQSKLCSSCIYRVDTHFDLEQLEEDVRDEHAGFKGHRICHHSDDACCRGFWNLYKDEFPAGQIAQRLGLVEFVDVDLDPTQVGFDREGEDA